MPVGITLRARGAVGDVGRIESRGRLHIHGAKSRTNRRGFRAREIKTNLTARESCSHARSN